MQDMKGRLNANFAEIDKQAQERFERLNNIRACAREIVNEEIIYA